MSGHLILPHHLRDALDAELERGERMAWIGQPLPARLARRTLPILLFAIPWTAFAVFWMFAAAGFEAPDLSGGIEGIFPLFGLPFVLVGLGMFSAPLWAARAARGTVYCVTDRRVLIIRVGRAIRVRSFDPEQLTRHDKRVYADGSGDLVFARELTRHASREHGRQLMPVGFLGVSDVRGAEAAVRELLEAHER